jgi:glycosyltransferase involved in cell wall biosynthesis
MSRSAEQFDASSAGRVGGHEGGRKGERVTFSVIVPTVGRPSLRTTLASIVEQLEPGDEVLVGCNRDGDFGNSARQSLLERARGTHLLFIDDDDQFARGAFTIMRDFARAHPGRIGVFRIRTASGRVLWRDPVLRRNNVSTQMFCIPNLAGKLGSWTVAETLVAPSGRRYDIADFLFLRDTATLQGEPIFDERVVAYLRADRRPAVRALQRARRALLAIVTHPVRSARRVMGRR